jgi:hypothetical protein
LTLNTNTPAALTPAQKAWQTRKGKSARSETLSALANSHRYIAIIPNAWGKGMTPEEAYKNAKSNGHRGRQEWKVIYRYLARFDKQVLMEGIGDLTWPKDAEMTKLVDTRTPAREKESKRAS